MSNKIQNKNWFNLFEIIKKISWTGWVFLLVIIIGVFLRTWQHHDWLRFNADQGRDAQIVSDAIGGRAPLPLLGPKAGGTEFRLGPAFYYLEFAAAKVFGDAPDKMAYPDLLTGILCISLLFFFLRKYFDKYASLSLVSIFAVAAYAVRYARFAWNPNSTPFWTILALLAIYEVVGGKSKRKFLWALVAGAAIGVGAQLHTTLLVILPLTTIIVFAWFSIKDKKMIKYFLVILVMALLVNAPQLVSEFQTKGSNAKDFFRGLKTKNNAEKSLSDNTIRGVSCWIQGNIDIVSGYEISDTCSFTLGRNAADTAVFLFGSLFVIGGMIFGVRYFLKEKNADRKTFLGIVFLFTGIAFLVFLKMAFELSMRFYLPLIFLPFFLLGFWILFFWEKFNARKNIIILVAAAFLIFSNLFFVQKYFSVLASYGKAGGGDVNVVILKEAEVFSQFIIQNSGGNQDAYIDGNGQFLFKGYKPIKYLVGKSNVDLHLASKDTGLPSQYFYIASANKMEKMQSAENIKIVAHETYGSFSVLLVQKI
jgi:4-amino-4-deoxy-L-arabinose transferase-like glycosyltransferase